ncbi:MAG: hypothetical protein ABI472_02165 [Ginsengibacter sp.]
MKFFLQHLFNFKLKQMNEAGIKSIYAMTIAMLCCAQTIAQTAKPASPPPHFSHKYETVNGIKIHYVTGGKGDPLLLIHGFGQN